jgi:hypothetical protein
MEQTQAQAPGQPQAQTPVHPIHQETETHNALTKWVSENPDNDPHAGTDLEAPPQETPEKPVEAEAPKEEGETVEIDEDTPLIDLEYKTDSGKETKKLSLKELKEGYLAKSDYHRNIQKVKAQEAEIGERVKTETLKAQQSYLQQLETHKQLVLKTVAPELQNVDLNKLSMEDPAEAQRIFFRQIQLNQTIQAIESEQRQALEKYQTDQKAAFEQAKVKARETLEADVKGWNEETYRTVLGTVAKDYGFKNEEVEPVVDARLIKVFHDAYQYRQLQKAKPEISKKVVAVPKVVKPGSAASPNTSNASDEAAQRLKKTGKGEDFVAWYMQQQKQQKRK